MRLLDVCLLVVSHRREGGWSLCPATHRLARAEARGAGSQEPIFPRGSRRPESAPREGEKALWLTLCKGLPCVVHCRRRKPLPALASRDDLPLPNSALDRSFHLLELYISHLLNKGDNHQTQGLS